MRVLLINNKAIPPYISSPDMKEGDIYIFEKSKINCFGDLVYLFDGFYGWRLATRFVIWEYLELESVSEKELELELEIY